VKPPDRWPLHPAPIDGESLSSWLRRLGGSYQMTIGQLIEHGLGHDAKTEESLDLDPPTGLLATLTRRTGITKDRVREMCLAGWTPWLLDSLEPHPSAFQTYVRQFSVLLRPGKRSKHSVGRWVAWLPPDRLQRACPRCAQDPGREGLLLIWQLPISLSCPYHGLMLKPCLGFPGDYLVWADEPAETHTAMDAVLAMDQRTQQALRTGRVELPGASVHAGVWFRLLRVVLDEVSTPLTYWGSRAADLRLIWDSCRHPVRAGQAMWRPFEAFTWPIQAQLLQAAAEAIRLLEDGAVSGRGTHAKLFFPLHPPVDDGQAPSAAPKDAYGLRGEQVKAIWDEVVQAARESPAEAQALYDLLISTCRTPESIEQVRSDLTELGIRPPICHASGSGTVPVTQNI